MIVLIRIMRSADYPNKLRSCERSKPHGEMNVHNRRFFGTPYGQVLRNDKKRRAPNLARQHYHNRSIIKLSIVCQTKSGKTQIAKPSMSNAHFSSTLKYLSNNFGEGHIFFRLRDFDKIKGHYKPTNREVRVNMILLVELAAKRSSHMEGQESPIL